MDENNVNSSSTMIHKGMKACRVCGKPVAKSAKVCPNCGAKQKGNKLLIIIGVIVVLGIIGAVTGGNKKKDTNIAPQAAEETAKETTGAATDTATEETADEAAETVTEEITYTEYDMSELMDDLENNAAAANEKYKGQYVALTGRLSNIDAQGSYISISDPDNELSFQDCRCDINGKQEISDIVKTLSKGDIITVKGKITDVGEIMGYYLDIDEIVTE